MLCKYIYIYLQVSSQWLILGKGTHMAPWIITGARGAVRPDGLSFYYTASLPIKSKQNTAQRV